MVLLTVAGSLAVDVAACCVVVAVVYLDCSAGFAGYAVALVAC